MYVCLLITLTRNPKAELRRAQLNGIGLMHMKGASGCRQTVMNDPGAQQPSQMFFLTWVKARPQHRELRALQMDMLAKDIAAKLQNQLAKDDALVLYGETLKYKKVLMGKMEVGGFVSVEEFIEGGFTRYINDNRELIVSDSEILKKAESLAHFSYECSEKEIMILDMQGSGYHLFDPEIASQKLIEDEEVLFSTGNLSTTVINNFIRVHNCNVYCNLLGLQAL